eukprot:Rmarinus@m.17433
MSRRKKSVYYDETDAGRITGNFFGGGLPHQAVPDWAIKPNKPGLTFVTKTKKGKTLKTDAINSKEMFLIGRHPSCDIVLDHPSVSRRHAALVHHVNGLTYLVDLDTSQGTHVDGTRIEPNRPLQIDEGLQIRFGNDPCRYEIETILEKVVYRSCFFFDKDNSWRIQSQYITTHPWFNNFILLVIVVNCMSMAMMDPVDSSNPRNSVIETLEVPFLMIFTVELVLKVVADGFIMHEGSYLRDGWNILDFVVVVSGYSTFLDAGVNVSALRTVRVLRPLRTISTIPELRLLVATVISSMPLLMNVLGLLCFMFLLFSILGMSLFGGALRGRCFYNGVAAAEDSFLPREVCGYRACPDIFNSTLGEYVQGECIKGDIDDNPNNGVTNFDNVGWSLLTAFQCATLEGWSDILYWTQDGSSPYVWIYFVALVTFISFFVVNLLLAVISTTFDKEAHEDDDDDELYRRKRNADEEDDRSVSSDGDSKDGDDDSLAYQDEPELLTVADLERKERSKPVWEPDRTPGWKWARRIVEHPKFVPIIVLFISINTVVMTTSHYDEPDWLKDLQFYANFVFTGVFAGELVLKVGGLGIAEYTADSFNNFDAVIVFASILELFLPGSSGISVLRTFRLLRAFKLARSWVGLRRLLNTVLLSVASIGYFSCLMVLFIFIYSMMGMQMYGGEMYTSLTEDGERAEIPRANFDDFLASFTTVFQIITGENWNTVMYDAIYCCNTGLSILFFVSLFVLGQYIVLNLFLVLLLQHFGESDDDVEDDASDVFDSDDEDESDDDDLENTEVEKRKEKYRILKEEGNSLYVFAPRSRIRMFCHWCTNHTYFEPVILFLIALNSVALCFDDSGVVEDSTKYKVLYCLDIFFTSCFTIEFLMKVIVVGFVVGDNSYLRDSWNVIDFVIVTSSLLNLVISADLSFMKAFRSVRALRPLRAVSRVPELKVVVNALFATFPPMMNVVVVCGLFYIIFGVLGVELWAGRMNYCLGGGNEVKFSLDKDACESAGYLWFKPHYSFDNIFEALLTLFEITSLEAWPDIMWAGVDATNPEEHPIENNNRSYIFFFVAFVVVGSFFLLNLFVGIVIDTFTKLKQEYDGSALLTETQRDWIEVQRMCVLANPKHMIAEPASLFRAFCFRIVTSMVFEGFILACIVVSTVSMATRHYDMSESEEEKRDFGNKLFTGIFLAEVILKIAAFGRHLYFNDPWNRFDFVISIATLPGAFWSGAGISYVRMIRIARIFRVIESAGSVRALLKTIYLSLPTLLNVGSLLLLVFFIYATLGMTMFGTVKHSIYVTRHNNFENFPNAMLLLFRISTGESWNGVMSDCAIEDECEGTEEEIAFKATFPYSGCCSSQSDIDNCGSESIAKLYFVSFQVLGSFILLNLFIAVILENFDNFNRLEELPLQSHHVRKFKMVWATLDPFATQYIRAKDLEYLLVNVGPPLGLPPDASRRQVLVTIRILHLPHYHGKVHFEDVLLALAKKIAVPGVPRDVLQAASVARSDKRPPPEWEILRKKGGKALQVLGTDVESDELKPSQNYSPEAFHAATVLQSAYRGFQARKKVGFMRRTDRPKPTRDTIHASVYKLIRTAEEMRCKSHGTYVEYTEKHPAEVDDSSDGEDDKSDAVSSSTRTGDNHSEDNYDDASYFDGSTSAMTSAITGSTSFLTGGD